MSKELMIKKRKEEIFTYFDRPVIKKQMQESLPKVGITAERMTRILFSSIAENPMLAECSTKSLFNSLIQCAQIGLEPNTVLGHAYLIPFKNKRKGSTEAKLILGYKGLIALAHRTHDIASIYAQEVYSDDIFKLTLGTHRDITHIPSYSREEKEEDILGAYAVVTLKNGSTNFEYLPKYDIDKIRARSMASNSGPWVSDYVMMARKTVIKRLIHYVSLSADIAEALSIDNNNDNDRMEAPPVLNGKSLTDQILGDSSNSKEEIVDADFTSEQKDEKSVLRVKPSKNETKLSGVNGVTKPTLDKDLIIKKIYALASDSDIVINAIEADLGVKTLKSVDVDILKGIVDEWDTIKKKFLPEEVPKEKGNNLL